MLGPINPNTPNAPRTDYTDDDAFEPDAALNMALRAELRADFAEYHALENIESMIGGDLVEARRRGIRP